MKFLITLVFSVILVLLSSSTSAVADEPLTHIVQLKHGKVHGKVVTFEDTNNHTKKVELFEGIKYGNHYF